MLELQPAERVVTRCRVKVPSELQLAAPHALGFERGKHHLVERGASGIDRGIVVGLAIA